jgi:hypothetical protein
VKGLNLVGFLIPANGLDDYGGIVSGKELVRAVTQGYYLVHDGERHAPQRDAVAWGNPKLLVFHPQLFLQ